MVPWLNAYFIIGAGAGAGEKNTRSRSKMDRLRNTDCRYLYLWCSAAGLQGCVGRGAEPGCPPPPPPPGSAHPPSSPCRPPVVAPPPQLLVSAPDQPFLLKLLDLSQLALWLLLYYQSQLPPPYWLPQLLFQLSHLQRSLAQRLSPRLHLELPCSDRYGLSISLHLRSKHTAVVIMK